MLQIPSAIYSDIWGKEVQSASHSNSRRNQEEIETHATHTSIKQAARVQRKSNRNRMKPKEKHGYTNSQAHTRHEPSLSKVQESVIKGEANSITNTHVESQNFSEKEPAKE